MTDAELLAAAKDLGLGVCEDCHRTGLTVVVRTDYGATYCRDCAFIQPTPPKKPRGKR